MKYLSAMVTKLLTSFEFIDEQDRIEVKKEFDEQIETYKKSSNKIIQWVNAILGHPIIVFVVIRLYASTRMFIKKAEREDLDDDVNAEMKRAIKESVYNEMLDDIRES